MGNKYFQGLIGDFMRFQEVTSILLAGSRATQTYDAHSDYDVYVYVTQEIPVSKRKAVTDKYCSYMELNNQFWETEDDGILHDGTPIELIYRGFDWLEEMLARVLHDHQAQLGYTTCFWSNLLNATILYDRHGRAKALQEKYSIPYPPELQHAIIQRNYPILKQRMPAYYHQIQKAVGRGDWVSVNHRLAAFLASYFDILFAINAYPHPGEKRLLSLAQAHCKKLPKQFAQDINDAIGAVGRQDPSILVALDATITHLNELLKQENLFSLIAD